MGLTSALSLVGDADALRVLFLKDGLVSDHVFENAHTKERGREGAGWCRKKNQVNIPRSTERHPPGGSS